MLPLFPSMLLALYEVPMQLVDAPDQLERPYAGYCHRHLRPLPYRPVWQGRRKLPDG